MLEYKLNFFDDGAGDKTEEPTAKKLSDARKEGQVAKSKEVANGGLLLTLFLLMKLYVGTIGTKIISLFDYIYSRIRDYSVFWNGTTPVNEAYSLFFEMMLQCLLIILPILLIGFVVAFVADLWQVKWAPTTKPLQPKFNKLNPVNGFKRIFSLNSVMELLKSIVKIILIAVVVYFYIRGKSQILMGLFDLPVTAAISEIGRQVTNLGIMIAAAYLIVVVADFAYQKWKFHKDMKMTKQEVKDEYKQQEGDPQIKGKIRSKMMESSRRRMMQALPQADVVITNPTHYAVAIKYDPKVADAPYVVAKGENALAQRIKDVAKANNIEIYEDVPLARMLYFNVDVGQAVPPEMYQAVAEVLAFVYHLQGKV